MFVLVEVITPSFKRETGKAMVQNGFFDPSFEQKLIEVKSHSVIFGIDLYSQNNREEEVLRMTRSLLTKVALPVERILDDKTKVYIFLNASGNTDVKAGAHIQSLASQLF